ncbi:hypothetical protein [Nonomuraea jabiensis]
MEVTAGGGVADAAAGHIRYGERRPASTPAARPATAGRPGRKGR